VNLLSASATVIALGLLLALRAAKRRRRAMPCRQCTAQMPPRWRGDLCATCLRVREELQLLATGWRASTSLQWLVRREGQQLGPYGLAALRELAERGRLAADDLVWTEGMGRWRRADQIERLLPPAQKAAEAPRGKKVSVRAVPAPRPAAAVPRPRMAGRLATASAAAGVPTTVPAPTAVAPPPRCTPAARPAQGNVIAAHWRGELSLAAAYWGSWVPVTVLLTAAVLIATMPAVIVRIGGRPGSRDSALWVVSVLAAASVVALWQAVGLWRSADQYRFRGGPRVWAVAAKACVLLGVLQLAGAGFRELPLLEEAFAPAAMPEARAAELHVLNHGTTVAIGGRLSTGTAEALRIVLDATPTIRLVQLDTTGGSLGEGSRAGRLIAERGLATFAAHDCDSACVLAFLGGKQRYLGPQGRLAFRAIPKAAVGERTAQAANELLRAALADSGAPAAFSAHALATLAPRVWYPKTQELLDAHVVTSTVDAHSFAQNGFNAARAELEADFLSVPVFAVLQRLEPATFASLRDTYVAGVLGGVSRNEMSAKVRATMMENVIPKYVRMAPDQELIAYWRTQIDKAQELSTIDPRYCAEFLAPQAGADTHELVSLFSTKAQEADIQALADLMIAGAQHPQKVPPERAVQGALRESARRAELIVPGALHMVTNPGMASSKPSEFCHAEVAFYESILAMPSQRAGPLLRYLVAQG